MNIHTNQDRVLHTVRPLDYKNTCLEEIFLYIDILKNLDIKDINFNIKMFEKIAPTNHWSILSDRVREYIDNLNLKIEITHAPYENSLILSNGYNKELIERTKKAIEVTKILGAYKMVIHSGISYKNQKYDEDLTIKDNVCFWKEVCEYAKQNNIILAFENDVVADDYDKNEIFKPSLKTVNTFVSILKQEYDNVSICYDIGHSYIAHNDLYLDFMKDIIQNISCFHLHNNKGHFDKENTWKNDTHNPCFDGDIEFEEFFKNLKQVGYNKELIIESVYRDSGTQLEISIKKDYDYINQLKQK